MRQTIAGWTLAALAIAGGLALWAEMGLAVALGDAAWFCVS
ncbi:MAG: hypothetical protein ACOVKO_09385 [Elstera sp.]